MNSIKYYILLTLFLSLLACSEHKNTPIDLSGVNVNTEIIRFEQQFYTGSAEELPALKDKFSYLFPGSSPDSVWIAKMNDEDEQFLFEASQKEYQDFSQQKENLTSLFEHVKYYYPKFIEPKVITILTNVDYNNKVIYADSLLFISLDAYLGKEHEVYQDYPLYIKQNLTSNHLIVDVAEQLAEPILRIPASRSYVSRIIQQGKKLKLMESFLPEVEKKELIGYSPDQYQWAEISEESIWKYFVQKEMLYSNDPTLSERFITDAPFSKFYLEIDKDSPGKIGAWFGWQIVNSFMKNNDLTLQEMVRLDNEELFRNSKYKPRKK
jgi:gliding motility-associated lipoprotein GldB